MEKEPNVHIGEKRIELLSVYDNHKGKEVIKEELVDEVRYEGGHLKVFVNTDFTPPWEKKGMTEEKRRK